MPEIISSGDREIEFHLNLRAYKRGLTLRIGRDGGVVVAAPKSAPLRDIRQFVLKNADWIFKKQDYFKSVADKNPPKEFVNGELFSILGRSYALEIIPDGSQRAELNEEKLQVFTRLVPESLSPIRQILLEFYYKLTAEKAEEYVKKYSTVLGVMPSKIRIAEQKSRWGSCSFKGGVRFNWRLSIAPASVLEYVVVHELCHLKHPNHSERFWAMVQSVYPDYKSCRRWLKENSLALSLMFK